MISIWLEQELNKIKFKLIARRGIENVYWQLTCPRQQGEWFLSFVYGRCREGLHINYDGRPEHRYPEIIWNWLEARGISRETESEKVERILENYEKFRIFVKSMTCLVVV